MMDLTGLHYGNLTVEKKAEYNRHRQPMWQCKCVCGTTVVVVEGSLKFGRTKSCGCLKAQMIKFTKQRKRGRSWGHSPVVSHVEDFD